MEKALFNVTFKKTAPFDERPDLEKILTEHPDISIAFRGTSVFLVEMSPAVAGSLEKAYPLLSITKPPDRDTLARP